MSNNVPHRILVAGATGAIGRRLMPLLLGAGHEVAGITRSQDKGRDLRAIGSEAFVVDVFDADGLARAVASFHPDVVVHELTDLPPGLDPARMQEAVERNARIRDEGTRNLVRAAIVAGARRVVAQSIAWAYATGPEPHVESDPLDTSVQGSRAVSIRGVVALESQTLNSPPLTGLVLRYGQLYGPGTGVDVPTGSAPLHVDAAAYAAFLAIDRGKPGIFNIAEANSYSSSEKAIRELGWQAAFRLRQEDR